MCLCVRINKYILELINLYRHTVSRYDLKRPSILMMTQESSTNYCRYSLRAASFVRYLYEETCMKKLVSRNLYEETCMEKLVSRNLYLEICMKEPSSKLIVETGLSNFFQDQIPRFLVLPPLFKNFLIYCL